MQHEYIYPVDPTENGRRCNRERGFHDFMDHQCAEQYICRRCLLVAAANGEVVYDPQADHKRRRKRMPVLIEYATPVEGRG